MKTGFTAQYIEAPTVTVVDVMNFIMKECMRLAEKNVVASRRHYIQEKDIVCAMKYIALNTEFLKVLPKPGEISTSQHKHQQQAEDERQQDEVEDQLMVEEDIDQEEEEEEEAFCYAVDEEQVKDSELFIMWQVQFNFHKEYKEAQNAEPLRMRQIIYDTICKLEHTFA